MLPITRKISKYNFSTGNNITYIVIHATGNSTDTALANANYFNGADRGASAHYFVDDTSIYQVVEDYNKSWHCGDGRGRYGIANSNSIGIEMCQKNWDVTETTINNTIELVKYLQEKYNIPNERVVRHYDASRKTCPEPFAKNNWSRWWDFLDRVKNGTKKYKIGWIQSSNGRWWYSVNEDGWYYKDEWKLINGEWYYFDSEGYCLQSKWLKYKDKWYYLKESGAMAKNQWLEIYDEFYYFYEDGCMAENCVTPDGYTVDKDGAWIRSIPKK